MAEVLTFEEYAARNGASANDYGDHGLLSGAAHVPITTRRRHIRQQEIKDQQLIERREQLRAEYQQKRDAGEIREPTRIEKLRAAAAGHPDHHATQAARRILAKIDAQ